MILQKESDIKLIDTLEEKESYLKQLGVDHLIVHPFSKEFSRLSALEFTRDILVDQLQIATLFIGYDHRFGRNREATVEDFISFGKTYNFEVIVIPAQDISDITVSSTKIRKAISRGDFMQVQEFLGRPFQLSGKVIRGNGIGRKMAFPTANLQLKESYKIIPPHGVYLVSLIVEANNYFGMMNIGVRPTLNGSHRTLEVHIFDLNTDLYGKTLQISLLEKIRDEKKFESLEALKIQLIKDKEICKETLIKKE
jgi:riboflavin kinase/FMN adenylyltransferase